MQKYIKLSVGWCRRVKDLDDLWALYEEGGRRIVHVKQKEATVHSAGFVAHWTYAKLRSELPALWVLEEPKTTLWDKIKGLFMEKCEK